MKNLIILFFLIYTLIASYAFACLDDASAREAIFESIDSNNDSIISREEYVENSLKIINWITTIPIKNKKKCINKEYSSMDIMKSGKVDMKAFNYYHDKVPQISTKCGDTED